MTTTLELRGRDLAIVPPVEWKELGYRELVNRLFGRHLPAEVQERMAQDKRQLFLRVQPYYFSMVKEALSKQQTEFTVAFEERPALPWKTQLALEARPY